MRDILKMLNTEFPCHTQLILMWRKKKWTKDDFEILSDKEFILLCFSAPAILLFAHTLSEMFPSVLQESHIVNFAVTLQGVIVVYFIRKRNPDIDVKLKEMSQKNNHYTSLKIIRLYTVIATGVLGMVVWTPIFTWIFL